MGDNAKVKTWKKVPLRSSIHMRVLHQDYGWRVSDIWRQKYPKLPRQTVDYHAKKDPADETEDRRKKNPGRPRKMNTTDVRRLKRKVTTLRQSDDPNFTAVKLQKVCDLSHVSTKTIHRRLNETGYQYLNTRQKGILTEDDRRKRTEFCRKCQTLVGDDLWFKAISFYYDGVNFYHKNNPFSDAVAPRAKVWRMPSEGLKITRKGKKVGNGGKKVRLFVAMAYGKGVIMCEQFPADQIFNGVNYRQFVLNHFPLALQKSTNPAQKLVLQDGDPVQKSKQARLAYDAVGCSIFDIPARSPDLNPIENLFHNVRRKLYKQAKKNRIEKETYDEYASRVMETIRNMPKDLIDETIKSLPERVQAVIDSKGDRSKW